MNNPMNLDPNTLENLQKMMGNTDISEVMSKISPEMINNFSKMISTSQNNSNENNSNNSKNENNTPNFDFNNIDINTIMKITSAFNSMNQKDDPRANLLASLKPYLRDNKKDKLDNYVNLLKVSKIAEVLKNDNKENQKNENEK